MLSLTVLAGFGAGIFLYVLSAVLIWGGVVHLLDGLISATMQAIILTIVLSTVIAPAAFLLLWLLRDRIVSARAFPYSVGIGALAGVLAGLAGLKVPII